MRCAFVFALVTAFPGSAFAWNVPQPQAVKTEQTVFAETGPVELALHVSGHLSYTDVGLVRVFLPSVDLGGFAGTGLGRGWALGYHGRLAIEPAEIFQRHALSLAMVRHDGSVLMDAGFGLFDGEFGAGSSVLFGITVQAKLFGTGVSLIVPLYCDVIVDPAPNAWVTFGIGIGYSTL